MADRPSSTASTDSHAKVRVVVVSHGPPVRGGIATVALDIVEDKDLNDEFEIVFVNTSQNDDGRGDLRIANIARAISHAVETFRAARRGSVVHTHSVQHPVFVAWRQVAIAVAARLRGARVILHNHGFLPYMCEPGGYRIGPAHRAAFAVLDRLCAANVLIGDAGVPNMRPYMPTIELPVVHNSVVVDKVTAGSGVHDPPVLLFVGELLERKGLAVLLDALDMVDAQQRWEYDLRIVGDDTPGLDPDKDAMVARIRERGRGDALTGPIERSEVYRHMGEADVFVLPTEYEGQPFTIIEALASGAPIVASDIPAIRSMLIDEGSTTGGSTAGDRTAGDSTAGGSAAGGSNGSATDRHALLVPWGDARALADALVALLADPDRRAAMSAANRDLAKTGFDRSVFRGKLAELYRRHGRR